MVATAIEFQKRAVARAVVASSSRLLRKDADDADAWHALGVAFAALGNRVGAFKALRNAILLDGGRAQTQLALGRLLFDTGQVDDALRCFECAAARDRASSIGGS